MRNKFLVLTALSAVASTASASVLNFEGARGSDSRTRAVYCEHREWPAADAQPKQSLVSGNECS